MASWYATHKLITRNITKTFRPDVKAPEPPPAPPPPSPAALPTMDDATVQERKRRTLDGIRRRRGRDSTMLSSGPLGDQGAAAYKPILS